MAKFDKKLTTFDVKLGSDKVEVDMGEVADLVYCIGVNVRFVIDKQNMTVFENTNGTYLVCVHCISYASFDHYGGWDANPEYDLHRKCDAELTVLPDGSVVSANLTNVQGAAIYDEKNRPTYKDIHYGLKPQVMDYLSLKPQRALLVNLHKIKNPAELRLFVKFAEHALDNSTMPYKNAVEIKHKLAKKVEKILGKVESKEKDGLSK